MTAAPLPAIRPATAADEHGVVRLLAEAFRHDPIVGWITGDDSAEGRRRQAFFRLCFQLRDLGAGEVLTTDGHLGAFTWHLSERTHVGLVDRVRQLPNFLGFAAPLRVPRLLAFFAALEARRPAEPHVYTQFLGIRPGLQRSGLGSALMRRATDEADRLHRPTYGETSRALNVHVWGRSGFEDRGRMRLAPGAPELWQILRPAR